MEQNVQYSGWRAIRDHKPPHHLVKDLKDFKSELFPIIPATRFFDQLSFIGNEFVGCFVLETSEGLLLIDCMEPSDYYIDVLENGLKDLGLNAADIKVVIVTHGHHDHYGRADRLRKLYGTKIYMSEIDEAFAIDPATPRAPGAVAIDWKADGYIGEGDVIRFGGHEIQVYFTPGHTPGGLSFIFNVTDEGRPHKVALWGGSGIPRDPQACKTYLESAKRFVALCKTEHVDAEISTHPFVDLSSERLAVCRNIVNGVANPFVIGEDAVVRYHEMFVQRCLALGKFPEEEKTCSNSSIKK